MSEFNTVWIASIPRTGSMWTTNVIRQIFLKSNYNILPKDMLKSDDAWINFYNQNALSDLNNLNRYIIKTHSTISKNLTRSKIITNIRNPYHICSSYYQFTKCEIDEALKVADILKKFIDFLSKKKTDLLKVKFEEIENNSYNLIKKIVDFCENDLSEDDILNIDRDLKKDKVKMLINKNDEILRNKIKNEENINQNEIVILNKKRFRSHDTSTGFQTGHISLNENKEWKKIFKDKDIEKMISILDPIAIEMGYSSEKN